MSEAEEKIALAIKVARMYYYQNITTERIARELGVSRSTISRLLTYAKEGGLVEVRIHDPREHPQRLERSIQRRFGIRTVKVVSVPSGAGEHEWLERVAAYTASYLNTVVGSNMVLGLAWGTTLNAIARHLTPKATVGLDIVQLNGAGNTQSMGIAYASEIIIRFVKNYRGRPHLFPVPTFFDYAETKQALWRERTIRRILALQQRADVLLYSVGAVQSGVPSHVYSGGYLESADYAELEASGVAGDIATVFFRADGSFDNIPLNARASGPDLALFRSAQRGICVVSGLGKAEGLRGALLGGLMTDLIVDEPTARLMLELPEPALQR